MSGCHHVTIHYLSQWWLGSVSLSPGRSELMASQWLHTTHPWINGWRYQDKHVYMNTYIYIYIHTHIYIHIHIFVGVVHTYTHTHRYGRCGHHEPEYHIGSQAQQGRRFRALAVNPGPITSGLQHNTNIISYGQSGKFEILLKRHSAVGTQLQCISSGVMTPLHQASNMMRISHHEVKVGSPVFHPREDHVRFSPVGGDCSCDIRH